MLEGVLQNSTERLREVKDFLNFAVGDSDPVLRSSVAVKTSKGLFFVHLYGSLEYTVNSTVQSFLENIQEARVNQCKPRFLSVLLDRKFKSIEDGASQRKWDRRIEFLDEMFGGERIPLDSGVFSYELQNIWPKDLINLWSALCVEGELFPDPVMRGRIEELTNLRNAIAHGREAASEIGGRFSADDLRKRLEDIDQFSTNFVLTLQDELARWT